MRIYDTDGNLLVSYILHASEHEAGEADEVSLAASQITSGRFGKTRLEWTADKLLSGAGVGADPTEIDRDHSARHEDGGADEISVQGLSGVLVDSQIRSKTTVASRDLTAASGDVSYTGVDFLPTSVVALGSDYFATAPWHSIGFADSAKSARVTWIRYTGNSNSESGFLVFFDVASGAAQAATLKSYDADGGTLTWTKVGSPTGTGIIQFMWMR